MPTRCSADLFRLAGVEGRAVFASLDKLFKSGAPVAISVGHIKVAKASACPWANTFGLANAALARVVISPT